MSMAAGIAGGALNAFGTETQDKTTREQLQTERNIAVYNAKVERQNAEDVRRAARFNMNRQLAETSFIESLLQARLGGSGAATDVGAPLEAVGKQANEFDLDRMMMSYEGEQQARQHLSQAALDDMDAQALEAQARDLRRARYVRSAGAFFGGGGAAAFQGMGGRKDRLGPREQRLKSKPRIIGDYNNTRSTHYGTYTA